MRSSDWSSDVCSSDLLDRDGVHHAPAGHEDPVGPQAADLQPCRALLLPGMVDGEQGQLEAVLVGQLLERRVGFIAVGAVVEDLGDLLALQLVHPAFLLAVFSYTGRGLAPIRGWE